MRRLSERQKKFCYEYVVDFNGAQAAMRAGYSKKTAHVQASQLLALPHVEKFLSGLMKKIEPDIRATADRVVKELSRMAFYDPADFFKRLPNGKLVMKDIDELTPDQRAAVAEFDPKKGVMKMCGKESALDKLGRHFKLFTDMNEHIHSFTVMPTVKLGRKELIFNVGQPAPEITS